jgi:hypothetical protein
MNVEHYKMFLRLISMEQKQTKRLHDMTTCCVTNYTLLRLKH